MSSTHPTESAPRQQADRDLIYVVIGLSGRIVVLVLVSEGRTGLRVEGPIVKGEFAPDSTTHPPISA